jgi:predicted membrane protein DUF2232
MSMTATVRAGDSREPRSWGPLGAALLVAGLFSTRVLVPELALVCITAAAPVALQRLRGTGSAFVTVLTALLLIGSLFGFEHALFFTLVIALPGLLLGEAMVRGRGLRRGALWAFLLVSAEVLCWLAADPDDMQTRMMGKLAVVRSPEYLAQLRGWVPADQVEDWATWSRQAESALSIVYPAAAIILGGLMIAINAAIVRAYLARRDPAWLDGGEFEGLRQPFALAFAFVLAGATVVIPPLRNAGYNVLLIVAFLLALQGLAVVLYYAHRLAGPPFLRRVVVVLVLINPWAPYLLGLLGLFDLWFDFRKYADLPESAK